MTYDLCKCDSIQCEFNNALIKYLTMLLFVYNIYVLFWGIVTFLLKKWFKKNQFCDVA
jgi:hypothetical protein